MKRTTISRWLLCSLATVFGINGSADAQSVQYPPYIEVHPAFPTATPAPLSTVSPSIWTWNEGNTPRSGPSILQSLYVTASDLRPIANTQWGISNENMPNTKNLSAFATKRDVVLNASYGGDLIITNRSPNLEGGTGALRFGTTPVGAETDPGIATDYERMTIVRDGFVGIGNITPQFWLTVAGHPAGSAQNLFGGSNPGTIIEVHDKSATYGGIAFTSAPGVDFSIGKKTDGENTYFQIRRQQGDEFVSVDVSGNFGIGRIPEAKLDVRGNVRIGTTDGIAPTILTLLPKADGAWWNMASVDNGGTLVLTTGNPSSTGDGLANWTSSALAIKAVGGDVGIGTLSPGDKLHVEGGGLRVGKSGVDAQLIVTPADGNYSNFATTGDVVLRSTGTAKDLILSARTAGSAIRFGTNDPDVERMTILSNGNVGIGVTNPRQPLVVNGMICAKEVRVSLSGNPCWWPDYVFEDDYHLMPLETLEQQIRQNRHLPGIPSAAEIAADGVQLGDMQAKLLQKVEELTLYVIEQNKQLRMLETEVETLRGSR